MMFFIWWFWAQIKIRQLVHECACAFQLFRSMTDNNEVIF